MNSATKTCTAVEPRLRGPRTLVLIMFAFHLQRQPGSQRDLWCEIVYLSAIVVYVPELLTCYCTLNIIPTPSICMHVRSYVAT